MPLPNWVYNTLSRIFQNGGRFMKPNKPTKQLLKRLNVYLDYLKSLEA